jgi:hypothetical protein
MLNSTVQPRKFSLAYFISLHLFLTKECAELFGSNCGRGGARTVRMFSTICWNMGITGIFQKDRVGIMEKSCLGVGII